MSGDVRFVRRGDVIRGGCDLGGGVRELPRGDVHGGGGERVRFMSSGDVLGRDWCELFDRVRFVPGRDDLTERELVGRGLWVRRWNL